jgi:hypothetical protein
VSLQTSTTDILNCFFLSRNALRLQQVFDGKVDSQLRICRQFSCLTWRALRHTSFLFLYRWCVTPIAFARSDHCLRLCVLVLDDPQRCEGPVRDLRTASGFCREDQPLEQTVTAKQPTNSKELLRDASHPTTPWINRALYCCLLRTNAKSTGSKVSDPSSRGGFGQFRSIVNLSQSFLIPNVICSMVRGASLRHASRFGCGKTNSQAGGSPSRRELVEGSPVS